MARLVIIALLTSLSSPALAAGGWDDAPLSFMIYMWLVLASVFGLPTVGFGYFLQALMRLRTAVLIFGAGFLILEVYAVSARGFSRALELTPLFAILLLVCATLFCAGWCLGIWAAKHQTKRQMQA